METLVGSWKANNASRKNINAFFDAAEIPAEVREHILKRQYFVTFSVNGNKLRSVEKVTNDPSLGEQIIETELDKECEYTDVDGQRMKAQGEASGVTYVQGGGRARTCVGRFMVKISYDGTKFLESYSDLQGHTFTCVREVKGNIMSWTMTNHGVTTYNEWERC